MITITLRRIMAGGPCYDPIDRGVFEKGYDLDAPISFRWLAKRIPPEDVIWCFAKLPTEHALLKRHFSTDCAERVRHLLADERSLSALTASRRHALGGTGDHELRAAYDAARDASYAARDAARGGPPWAKVFEPVWANCKPACVVACDAVAHATACRDAVWATARDAASAVAVEAAWAACDAAWNGACDTALAARVAATWDAAWDAARTAELRWQVQRIIKLTETGEWSPVG